MSPLRSTGLLPPVTATVDSDKPELAKTLDVLAGCADLSSTSDEPYLRSTSWQQRFNFHPSRTNLVRALTLESAWRVLELVPGHGSLTRYLGERCAHVDAIDPEPDHAQITRARTVDLPNVEVFVGDLQQVSAEPFYDLILVNDLLEYAGAGTGAVAPYVDLITAISQRLAPGGSIVLGTDNKLGVKYLVGAPETYSQRPFNSVEDFGVKGPARTFTRAELIAILADAGLYGDVLACFPDHRLTRFVFEPTALARSAPQLISGVPGFPSQDWGERRVDLANERLAWKSMVQGELAGELANSFLVIASRSADQKVWPTELGGVFFSNNRRAEFTCQTRIELGGGKVMLRRTRTSDRPQRGDFRIDPQDADYVPGVDLVDAFVDIDDASSLRYLREWAEMVRTSHMSLVPYDLIPHNIVIGPDDGLHAIDDEWRSFRHSRDDVLSRGVLLLGQAIASRGRMVGSWQGCETFRDVVVALGAAIGLVPDGSWIEAAVVAEARFQAAVTLPGEALDRASGQEEAAERLYSFLAQDIAGPDFLTEYRELRSRAAEVDRLRADSAHADALAATAAKLVLDAENRTAAILQELHKCKHAHSASDSAAPNGEVDKPAEWAVGEVGRMRATVSWRATKPLRWVRRNVGPHPTTGRRDGSPKDRGGS